MAFRPSIITPPGTLSFPVLDKPRSIVDGAEPRYSIALIFNPEQQARPEFREMQKAVDEAIRQFWPAKVPVGLRSPFKDAGEKEGQYEGYKKGDIVIQPWSKSPPGLVNNRREPIIDHSDYYAGWLVRAKIRPFAYDQGGNKGVNFNLDHVQFLKPGKRLDGRKSAEESFPDDGEFADEEMV